MYVVNLINLLTKVPFSKEFTDYEKFRKFVIKCDYSKKVKITSIVYPGKQIMG